ncbi:hypothetical protein Tco_1245357 [Tanacetum coccineum]
MMVDDQYYAQLLEAAPPRPVTRMPSLCPRSPRTTSSLSTVCLPFCSKQAILWDMTRRSHATSLFQQDHFYDEVPECPSTSQSKVRNSHNKPVVEKVSLSSSTPGISPDVAELKDMVKALLLDKKSQAPTPVKAG